MTEPNEPEDDQRARDLPGLLVAFGTMLAALFVLDSTFASSAVAKRIDVEETFRHKTIDYPTQDADIVITGDSRIYHGINPDELSSVVLAETGKQLSTYNFGVPYGHACTMLLFADRIVENKKHLPRVAVLAPSAIMWSSPTIVPSDVYFSGAVRPGDIVPLALGASTFEEAFADVTLGAFQLEAERTRVLNILFDTTTPHDPAPVGHHGWVDLGGRVDAGTQDVRARGRANGYTPGLHSNHGVASDVADKYLRHTIARLQGAGIKVAIISSAQSRQLDINHDAGSIYPDYLRRLAAIAGEFGVGFTNLNDCPVIDNVDFEDGDHLSNPGATKLASYVAHNVVTPLVGPQKIEERADCRVVFDFDEPLLPGWTLTGSAFGGGTCPGAVGDPTAIPTGYLGPRFLSSRNTHSGDAALGTATSPPFTIDGKTLRFRINGGANPGLEVALLVGDTDRHLASGRSDEAMSVVEWDVSALAGTTARLVVRDGATNGHIGIDDVRVCP